MFPIYFWILTTPLACPYWQALPGLQKLLDEAREELRKEEQKGKAYEEMRRKLMKDGKLPARP